MAKPIRMVTANLDFTTTGRRDRRYLRRLGTIASRLARPTPGRRLRRILFLQEAKTSRVRRTLRGYWGIQGQGQARSGTALYGRGVWLKQRGVWLAGHSDATLPRYVTEAVTYLDGVPILCLSAHVFPARAGRTARDRYIAKLKERIARAETLGIAWVIGGDFNLNVREVAMRLGGQPFGAGIIGFVCSPNVWVAQRGVMAHGLRRGLTDHPAYFIDVVKVAATEPESEDI